MSRLRRFFARNAPLIAFVLVCVFMTALTASAQTATPVPTAVPTAAPISIEIDTNQVLSQANTWIANLLPIFAITIGITIALSALGYVSGVFGKVFKGGK